MTRTRMQHLVPGILVLLLAALVAWLSFTNEPAEAFLFPRLIATVMLALALWNFVRAAMGMARVGTGFSGELLKTIAPGVLVVLIYVFYLAKLLGFYVSSALVFVVLYAIYDPAPHMQLQSWIRRIAVALAFMALIYGLFNMVLKVQTPRGMFF